MKVIVAITGATGTIIGIRLLQRLMSCDTIETHLILSKWGEKTIELETDYTVEQVIDLADYSYNVENLGAAVASGSFEIDAMIIAPCSMKSLASIRHGLADNLISRAADVILKEGRKLILMPRETPLNTIHLENMLSLSRMGVVMVPPMPSFYNKPDTIEDIIDHIVYRVLNQLGINIADQKRWKGISLKDKNI